MFICTDLTETIVDGGEKMRLRNKLHDDNEIDRIWHFPDHLFVLWRGGHQLDSFRLLEPRSAATSQTRGQQNNRFADSFLNKLLGNSPSPSKSVTTGCASVRPLDSISLQLDQPTSVVQVERLDDHVVIVVVSDGSIRAYRFDPCPSGGWNELEAFRTTDPTLNQQAGSVVTSAGVVPHQSRPYTLYWCERNSANAPPWNCSVFRRHFRLAGSPPREVVFEEPTTTVLELCPAARFVHGKLDTIIWFPPSTNPAQQDDNESCITPAGLVFHCAVTSKITALVFGNDRHGISRPHASRDFWSCCVDVLSDVAGSRLLDLSTATNDRLVVRTESDVIVTDWCGKELTRRNVPLDVRIIGCRMFGSGLLCLIGNDSVGGGGNRIWVTDLDDRSAKEWISVEVGGPAWSGLSFRGDSCSILLWSFLGLQQITRRDFERMAGVVGLAESRLLSAWDLAYRHRDLPEFHFELRVPDTRPPLEYSAAMPLVLAHRSVDHTEATPLDVSRTNEVIRFLEKQHFTSNSSSYTTEQRHLRSLSESYFRVQRILHSDEQRNDANKANPDDEHVK